MKELIERLFDITVALIAIILFAPIIVCVAIFIKLVSPGGPVLADIPDRVGKDQQKFRMYKFRSMIVNAHKWFEEHPDVFDEYKKNNFKLDNDPRWIKGARFLRKYSIDEFPQFFNILKGDMSIVGPRPYYDFELVEQEKVFPNTKADIEQALVVKPGITGPWQISGRANINFPERIKMDADYAKSKSLIKDIMILVITPIALFTKKGETY